MDDVLVLIGQLAWPITLLVILAIFHGPLGRAIDRLQDLKTPAVSGSFDTSQLDQQHSAVVPGLADGVEPDDSPGDGVPPAAQRDEAPEELPEDELPTPVAAEPDLVNGYDAAFWNAVWQHEVTYRTIFGTQIRLLRAVADSPSGLTVDDVRPYLAEHIKEAQELQPGYLKATNEYLGYLTARNLLTLDLTSGRYVLGAMGLPFLNYLGFQGLESRSL
ncbi:MAG: hypothetical protein M0R75_11540 [Dehalococcoidia bacterium]|nr:hypothetical protein [Dehalococcoidia bacterium]